MASVAVVDLGTEAALTGSMDAIVLGTEVVLETAVLETVASGSIAADADLTALTVSMADLTTSDRY
jgi:hypothetical protein